MHRVFTHDGYVQLDILNTVQDLDDSLSATVERGERPVWMEPPMFRFTVRSGTSSMMWIPSLSEIVNWVKAPSTPQAILLKKYLPKTIKNFH